jgi:DNA-binding response OmpR family regulator
MSVTTQPASCLAGRRILVVEDEFLIAMLIERCLLDVGCAILGPAPSIEAALGLIEAERPEGALLDVNLSGRLSTPVAARLAQERIPYLIVTGYVDLVLADPVLRNAPYMAKPFRPAALAARMEQVFC